MKHRCNGSVVVEYLLVFSLVVVLLFGPSPSVIDGVVSAIANFYKQFTFLLAMP